LDKLAPEAGEEEILADRRQQMMRVEKIAGDIKDAYDTVGGFIVHRVGRIPLPGSEVPFGDVTLKVEVADSRRVAKVLATRDRPPDAGDLDRRVADEPETRSG
jgi:CBS domain containing-hemolysin-like protein